MPNADRAGRSAHHSPVRSIRNSTQVDKGTVLKTDRRRKSCVGSNPTCSANAKAMCVAWLGAYALPGRLDPANLMDILSICGTPERRGRGGRNPATKRPFFPDSVSPLRPQRNQGRQSASGHTDAAPAGSASQPRAFRYFVPSHPARLIKWDDKQ